MNKVTHAFNVGISILSLIPILFMATIFINGIQKGLPMIEILETASGVCIFSLIPITILCYLKSRYLETLKKDGKDNITECKE